MKHFFSSLPVILALGVLGALAFMFVIVDAPTEVQASAPYGAADVPLEFHYNAFNSTFLRPEVAKLYGISRDDQTGVAMVSVYQKEAPGVGVQARISGGATNLTGQITKLRFNEVREGAAVYHVSTFSFSPEERLRFKVNVEIVQTGETRELEWRQQFWRD